MNYLLLFISVIMAIAMFFFISIAEDFVQGFVIALLCGLCSLTAFSKAVNIEQIISSVDSSQLSHSCHYCETNIYNNYNNCDCNNVSINTVSTEARYCPNCGIEFNLDSNYCIYCGVKR